MSAGRSGHGPVDWSQVDLRAGCRIGVLGYGAIGSRVAAEINDGRVPGAELAAVIRRRASEPTPAPVLSLSHALERCDVIVECAGQEALATHGQQILHSGADLLITSIGALADPLLDQRLRESGPGRLFLTSGAVGGLDLLAAGAKMGGFHRIEVTTRKLPGSLVQDWMRQPETERLTAAREPVEVFQGPSRQAARLFPKSLNVVAAVALAVEDWDVVNVRLVADPAAALTEHHIEAHGPAGRYSFTIQNHPDPANPRTSAVVPWAVLRSLETMIGLQGGLI